MKPTAVDSGKTELQAMEIAKSTGHPFPLILLDGQMPKMDGFTLAEVIHGDPELVGATKWAQRQMGAKLWRLLKKKIST